MECSCKSFSGIQADPDAAFSYVHGGSLSQIEGKEYPVSTQFTYSRDIVENLLAFGVLRPRLESPT